MHDKRPFPFYIGRRFRQIMLFGYANLNTTATQIIDRKEIGRDDSGQPVYSYRVDAGNTLVELWVHDTLLLQCAHD